MRTWRHAHGNRLYVLERQIRRFDLVEGLIDPKIRPLLFQADVDNWCFMQM